MTDGCHTTAFILNMPKLASRMHSSPNFHQTCPTVRTVLRRYGGTTHLTVLFDTALVIAAIATSVVVVVVAALITVAITKGLRFIRAQRVQPQNKRVSVIKPVIDICRPAHSNVGWNLRIVAPQRPLEALLSCNAATSGSCPPKSLPTSLMPVLLPKSRQPSPGIPTVPRYDDNSRRTGLTGLCSPSRSAKMDLDFEAQIWIPSRAKKNVKAKRSHALTHISPSVELPVSPPPSYSQIDETILVAAL